MAETKKKVDKIELENLIHTLMSFEKMYEMTRVVDPVEKKVLYIKGSEKKELIQSDEVCYDAWGRGAICKNCTSLRAYREKDTFIKIETSPDQIMMVTAIPVKVGETTVVVEFLKDVTKSMILDDVKLSDSLEIKKLLDRANQAVITDELTKIYNKRFILETLPVELSISLLEKEPYSLIMADIDHFKKINDTYGHLAGDHILKEFAEILNHTVRREKDWVARFGGEEFMIGLAQMDLKAAESVAERMRKAIEEKVFTTEGHKIQLTSSFGICTLMGDEALDHEILIRYADKNLYQAKNSGRTALWGPIHPR